MSTSGIAIYRVTQSITPPRRLEGAVGGMIHPIDDPAIGVAKLVGNVGRMSVLEEGRHTAHARYRAVRFALFSAILFLSCFVGERPAFAQGLRDLLCTQKCWFVDTLVSGNPFNISPTEEAKRCNKVCCESIGMRSGNFGCEPSGPTSSSSSTGASGGSSSSSAGGNQRSHDSSQRQPGLSDEVLEAAAEFGRAHPSIDTTSDFLYNYLTIVKVNEDCLVHCGGAQLIQMAFLNAAGTTLGGVYLKASLFAGTVIDASAVGLTKLYAIEGALAAGNYFVANGVAYVIGGIDKMPKVPEYAIAAGAPAMLGIVGKAGGKVIGYLAPVVADATRGLAPYFKAFATESGAIQAAKQSAVKAMQSALGPLGRQSPSGMRNELTRTLTRRMSSGDLSNPLTSKGAPKTNISGGSLNPANPFGEVKPYQHIGNYTAKAESSPWLSFSNGSEFPRGVERFGDVLITFDVDAYLSDAARGKFSALILSEQRLNQLLRDDLSSFLSSNGASSEKIGKMLSLLDSQAANPDKKAVSAAMETFMKAELGLSKKLRDDATAFWRAIVHQQSNREVLVFGSIPQRYLTVQTAPMLMP
jgi:hypothetical protein